MTLPSWITQEFLGEFPQTYSFDINLIELLFVADSNATVKLINGSLPNGLTWKKTQSKIVISGALSSQTNSIINSRFTFRISQSSGEIADRTFSFKLIPSAIIPSWNNTGEFLGYQLNLDTKEYQVEATIGDKSLYVNYILITNNIPGLSINYINGLITFNSSEITTDQDVSFIVRATATNGQFSDKTFYISVKVVANSPPIWITDSNLGEFELNSFFEYQLLATSINNSPVNFSIVDISPDSNLSLGNSGLLYGFINNSSFTNNTISINVSASNNSGTSLKSFFINVIPSTSYNSISWISPSTTSITEGDIVVVPVSASTTRPVTLLYSHTGGILPPNLTLNSTTGVLSGFCEFTPYSRVYSFEISVTDGYQSVTKQFNVTVLKKFNDQFLSIYIPVTGDQRYQFIEDSDKINNLNFKNSNYLISINRDPKLSIIDGLVTGTDLPNKILANTSPWFHTLDLRFGQTNVSPINNNSYSIYREINDTQKNSNLTVYSSSVYNTNVQTNGIVTPISINNIRSTLLQSYNFVGAGEGNGFKFISNLNWDTGGITNVSIINSGSGYLFKPEITVTGSGSDAILSTIIGITNVNVISSSTGWETNDIIQIDHGTSNVYAELTVTSISSDKHITSVEITNPGDYINVLDNNTITILSGNKSVNIQPNWGVVDVPVINSGHGYQCNIITNIKGSEILPNGQPAYFPIIKMSDISSNKEDVSNTIIKSDSIDVSNILGQTWLPSVVVLEWKGIKLLGSTTFDKDMCTFDGNTTCFEEFEIPEETVFNNTSNINILGGYSINSTIFDDSFTYFDNNSTYFDQTTLTNTSLTSTKRLINTDHKIYSSNNAIW